MNVKELCYRLELLLGREGVTLDTEVVFDESRDIRYGHRIESVDVSTAGDQLSKLIVLSPKKPQITDAQIEDVKRQCIESDIELKAQI